MKRIPNPIKSLVAGLWNPGLRRRVLAGDGPLVFVHVPRTAGTTFRTEILLPIFRRSEVYLIYQPIKFYRSGTWLELKSSLEGFRNALRLVAGHMPFDMEGILRHPRYMTFLREPVDRAISDYFYCRQTQANPAHEAAMEFDIAEFVRRGYGQTQNCQTRYLSNKVFGAEYGSDGAMLAAAKANLDRCFFFGLAERFEDSVGVFFRKVGYDGSAKDIPVQNRSRRPKDIPAEAREALARYNILDLELYAYACERFEAQAREES